MNSLWGDALPVHIEHEAPVRHVDAVKMLGRVSKTNPMIAVYGVGPDDKKCGDCRHFLRHFYHTQMLYKCRERGLTHGPGTDHRVRWPACSKYEEVQA